MDTVVKIPFFEQLQNAKNILISGAGGGFDIYSGIPLYFALEKQNKNVFLGNLSFTWLDGLERVEKLNKICTKITAESISPDSYFPEGYLSQWFSQAEDKEVPIYGLLRTGVAPLRETYQMLVQKLSLDAIVLVDGGTDSLMRGDEVGLGTPMEDITSIAAVADLENIPTYLACLGFGVDYFHGVCHSQFLEGVSQLIQTGDYLGVFSLLPTMEEGKKYIDAVEFANRSMNQKSIVCNSIVSAVQGHYGDYHTTRRTAGSTLWINPLMGLYWTFKLPGVAKRILYFDGVRNCERLVDLIHFIHAYRKKQKNKDWEHIPV